MIRRLEDGGHRPAVAGLPGLVNASQFRVAPGRNNALFTNEDSPVVAIFATDLMRIKILLTLIGVASLGLGAWAIAPVNGRGSAHIAPNEAVQESVAPPWSPKKQSAVTAPPPAEEANGPSPQARVTAGFDATLFNPHMTMPIALSMPTATPEPPAAPAASTPEPKATHKSTKPFRCPRGTGENADGLTVAEVAQIKSTLNLSKEQERHWRPVEAALTSMAKRLEEGRASGRKVVIPAERTQELYFAAGPLIRSLREDQKRDARNLACTMGLGAVAALI
jgi:hypothetical protein